MDKIILNCEAKSKHAIKRNLRQKEIDEIKEELKNLSVQEVMKKHGFNDINKFNVAFIHFTGITPKEYRSDSLEKKRFNYGELKTFLSAINSIDPFVFYILISRDGFFGFLTTNNNACIELRDMIYKHRGSIGISLKGQGINKGQYSGSLYEVLDKSMFSENYSYFIDKFKLNEFKIRYNKPYTYPIQEPINTLKKLLEEII